MSDISVSMEAESPESIIYERGSVCKKLTGVNAMIYRQMIWAYGKARAVEEFWWLWHKKVVL